ncbi:2-oxo acid dehydrogenase subunit E2 [Arthrobacter alpinus]|uniref:2-oxo acid dehydrogenase subunit E2 n=1 Tax=Arthrobacter alpinus TaxID=656366 RepID=UPI000AB30154|nr:2-oxo acid dehydrogenase subunit E2 [Arthrobacter alpinus]
MTTGAVPATRWPVIPKDNTAFRVRPDLVDCDQADAAFSWDEARNDLAGRETLRLVRADGSTRPLTVTNLGDLGVDRVYGVIYPPQVAMLDFGCVTEQPWAHNGLLVVRPAVIATLSAGHRVSDGLREGRYLARIDKLVQHPEEL